MVFKRFISKVPFKECCRLLASPKFRLVPQFLLVYCATEVPQKLEISTPSSLTHEFLLKQSSGVAVTAVAQLLHQTVCAYVDVADNYMKVLNKQISLIEDFVNSIGDVSSEEELSDSMIECRSEMKQYKEQFFQLESLIIYVEEMVNSTTQATFLAGAEYLSLTLCEQLVTAKREIKKAKSDVELTEQSYLAAEKEAIEIEKKKKDKGGEESFVK